MITIMFFKKKKDFYYDETFSTFIAELMCSRRCIYNFKTKSKFFFKELKLNLKEFNKMS